MGKLKSFMNMGVINAVTSELIEPFENAVRGPDAGRPNFLLQKLRAIDADPRMEKAAAAVSNPIVILDVFARASAAPPGDMYGVAQVVSTSPSFSKVASQNYEYAVANVLVRIMQRGPLESRLAIMGALAKIDSYQYLTRAMPNVSAMTAATYFVEAMKGSDTSTAIAELRGAYGWGVVSYKPEFQQWIREQDARLAPALG